MRVQWVLLPRTSGNDGTYAMSKVPINTEPEMWISVVGSKRPACSGRNDSCGEWAAVPRLKPCPYKPGGARAAPTN